MKTNKQFSLSRNVKGFFSKLMKGGKNNMPKEEQKYIANCLKCKKVVTVMKPELTELSGKGGSKRKAVKGKCSECNGNVFRILKKE